MTSEIEEAVARVEASANGENQLTLGRNVFVAIPDLRTILSALTASQAEVERLGREVNQFVTCMCGQPMSVDPYAHGHAPVSVAEHYYNEQYARAQAAEARATRAEGLLAEAGEVLGPMKTLADYFDGAEEPMPDTIALNHGLTLGHVRAARAFLDKVKGEG